MQQRSGDRADILSGIEIIPAEVGTVVIRIVRRIVQVSTCYKVKILEPRFVSFFQQCYLLLLYTNAGDYGSNVYKLNLESGGIEKGGSNNNT